MKGSKSDAEYHDLARLQARPIRDEPTLLLSAHTGRPHTATPRLRQLQAPRGVQTAVCPDGQPAEMQKELRASARNSFSITGARANCPGLRGGITAGNGSDPTRIAQDERAPCSSRENPLQKLRRPSRLSRADDYKASARLRRLPCPSESG